MYSLKKDEEISTLPSSPLMMKEAANGAVLCNEPTCQSHLPNIIFMWKHAEPQKKITAISCDHIVVLLGG